MGGGGAGGRKERFRRTSVHHSHWRQAHTVQEYSTKGAYVPAKTGEIEPSKLLERWPNVCRRLEQNIGTCRIITLNSQDI